jgi:transglutaminase-like putative cysteine protease
MRNPLISPLSLCHLVFLTVVALYLCVFHGAGEAAVWMIYATGVAAELLPRRWRQFLTCEALLLLSGGLSWLWLVPRGDHEAWHAWAGMGFTYLLLVPSSLERLRYIFGLVLVEMIVQGFNAGFDATALSALPVGVAALAVDGWLIGVVPARSAARLRRSWVASLVRWALLPAFAAAAIGVVVGGLVVSQAVGAKQGIRHAGLNSVIGLKPVAGLEATMHIGDLGGVANIQRDPVITARLSWETGPAPQGMVYLRAATLSNLHTKGSSLSWSMPAESQLVAAPPPSRTPQRWAWVYRLPSRDDVVMRPDGGDNVDLDGLMTDGDGNLFRSQLGEAPRIYRTDFDDGQLAADPAHAGLYRDVPPELEQLPWALIEQAHWREVSPERAAELICQQLRERCSYALEDLPPPANGPGGVLRTFLFGDTIERRGHCQYFATSAVLLLRRAGFQARCVAGFASDEVSEGAVVFRALHAHAWLEVVNSKGSWQRVDATPPGVLAQRSKGVNEDDPLHAQDQLPKAEQLPPAHDLAAAAAAAAHSTRRMLPLAGLAVLLLGVLWWRRRRRGGDPRLSELQRHSDSLLRVAASLGVPLAPSTTLSQVAAALQARTGIDLTLHLDQHLRARFGDGAMPAAWPINELRAAGRARRAGAAAEEAGRMAGR